MLATAWGASAHGWEALPALPERAELLFVATAASRPVVSAAELAAAVAGRSRRQLITMDLSVPRNVEPEARTLPGVRLFDLDDLQRLCCPAAGTPAAALHDAERVLDEEIARLEQQLAGRAAAPRLAELHRLRCGRWRSRRRRRALAQLAELSEQRAA